MAREIAGLVYRITSVNIAKGSAGEARAQRYIAFDVDPISEADQAILNDELANLAAIPVVHETGGGLTLSLSSNPVPEERGILLPAGHLPNAARH